MFQELMNHPQAGLSRRSMLAALGAAGLTAAVASARQPQEPQPQESKPAGSKPEQAQPPKPPAPPVGPVAVQPSTDLNGAGFYRFKLGTFTLTLLTDGSFPLGGASGLYPMIGGNANKEDVDAASAEVFIPPAKPLGHVHGMLIDTGAGDAGRVLIDTGCGSGMGPTTGRLLKAMRLAGVAPAQVGAVIITHAHPDHVGGLMEASGPGVFPNAHYFVHKAEVEFWTGNPDLSKSRLDPKMKDAVTMTAKTLFTQLAEPAYKQRFHQINDGDRVVEGVTLVGAPGHTPGHSAVGVASGNDHLLYFTDIVHHAGVQMPHPDWHVAYDADPVVAARTRRAVLRQVAADRMLVSGAHLPFPAVGHVRHDGSGFAWVARAWEW